MMVSTIASAAAAPILPAQTSVQPAVSSQRIDSFADSLTRATQGQAVEAAEKPVATGAAAPGDLDAQSRARRGLGLDGAAPVAKAAEEGGGEMILNGLQKLRGVFDAREARVNEVMNSATTDAHSLMAMQVEMTNFTLLVDISSKLTGKTTQSLDTLMKGQ